jgi:membrane-associated protease RseP (regulator of RpoE activity)
LGHLKNASVTHPEKTQLPLTLLRAGKPMTIQVKPEVRVALGTVVVPKPEYYLGLPSNPIDETLRTHLGLPEGQGLIVSAEPDANTPAAKAGIKKNDILLSFDGQPMTNTEVLRARIQVVGSKPTKADLVRAGKRIELLLTPEPRKPEPETNLHGEFLQQYYRSLLDNDTVPVLNDVPVLGRLYRADQLQIPINNVAPTASSPSPELTKKIDDLSAQVQALRKAIEELKTQAKPGESK